MFNLNWEIIFGTHVPNSLKNIFSDNIIYYIIVLRFKIRRAKMVQNFNTPQKTRQAVILFLKGSATPVVMYFENPQAVYSEFKQLMKSPTPVLVEKEPIGPIKRVCFVSTQMAGLVLQEEPYA
jgi:hypothetical protein